jgi:hypothetical protein
MQVKFFQLGELPTDDEKIRKLANATQLKARDWKDARDELMDGIFTLDWRNSRWEALLGKVHKVSAIRSDAAHKGWDRRKADDDRACVKTPTRFDTDLFCSLFRALRPLGSEKIAKNFALRDCLQKFAGFSHGLDPPPTAPPVTGRDDYGADVPF